MTDAPIPVDPSPRAPKPRTPRILAAVCLAFALLLPALVAFGLYASPIETLLVQQGVTDAPTALRAWQRVAIVVLGLLPVASVAFGLWQAARCFAGLSRGEHFSDSTAARLEGVGIGMVAAGLSGLLAEPLAGLVAIWHVAGTHALKLDFDAGVGLPLLFGAIVWQIAGLIRKAAALARENAQFA